MTNTIYRLFAIVVVAGMCWSQDAGSGTKAPRSVYIADFTSRNLADDLILASFTELYESALVTAGAYKVLNRRTFNQILAAAANEAKVASMSDLSPRAKARLAGVEKADGVIFGEVTDDKESGDIIISATLESFDSVKHWKRFVSMKRGLIRDQSSRRKTMESLAAEGSESTPPKQIAAGLPVRVSYQQACGVAGPLISSERRLAESVGEHLKARGISGAKVRVLIAAGYRPLGEGIVISGQFRVCRPQAQDGEICEPPAGNCQSTSCTVSFHSTQEQNRVKAEGWIAEAIADSVELENYEARSVCSNRQP